MRRSYVSGDGTVVQEYYYDFTENTYNFCHNDIILVHFDKDNKVHIDKRVLHNKTYLSKVATLLGDSSSMIKHYLFNKTYKLADLNNSIH